MVRAEPALYDQLQKENKRASRLLLIGSVVLAAVMVWIVAGALSVPVLDPVVGSVVTAAGLFIGLMFVLISVRSGPSVALRAAKAREVSREEAPELWNLFDEVCVNAGIMGNQPRLYLVDDPAPNAFATGLKLEDSHIAVTTGLIETLPRYELRAVLAHEVAHILNDDIRAVTIAVATAGLIALLADVLVRSLWFRGAGRSRGGNNQGGAQALFLLLGLLAVILAPLAAQLIRFAVSRQREYLADATAADLLRDPQSMVNALRRIGGDTAQLSRFEVATAHLWFEEPNDTDPTHGKAAKMASRFASHPSIQDRVERLARLNAGTVSTDAPLPAVDPRTLPAWLPRSRGGGQGPPGSPPPTSPPPGSPFGGFPGMPGS
ncbi:MAG: M48 family metalloprotease [Nitriliruptoraceae bacterium]|nr:M48 family metalloprotease [Nitriliruptoraceae bacterium]